MTRAQSQKQTFYCCTTADSVTLNEGLLSSDSSFPSRLVVGWQWFTQVDPHRQSKLLGGMFLMDLRLQLETLLHVKAIHGSEAERLLLQQAWQSFAPGLQHGGAGLRGKVTWSPEDLRGQNLEATVVQDAILQEKKNQC